MVLLVIIAMVIYMTSAEAWVGGRLSIESPSEGEVISGDHTFELEVTGDYNVSNAYVYGKAKDTDTPSFKLLGENKSCGPWNENEGEPCNVVIDTEELEDSSIWQFYTLTENASDPTDTVKSTTIMNLIVDNTFPSFQTDPFLSPGDREIVGTNNVKFGALVDPETVTHCIITFTSNEYPGNKRKYYSDYESGEYCNITIEIPTGFYSWKITASDGKDLTDSIGPQTFEVRPTKDLSKFTGNEEKKSILESSNTFWIAALVILGLILLKRRKN